MVRNTMYMLFATQVIATFLGARIEYLPPYLPDFNPIEQSFSCLKAFIPKKGRLSLLTQSHWRHRLGQSAIITSEKALG
jgi:hypothetical protein